MAKKRKQKEPGWKDVEKKISKFENAQLLELLRDLYQLSPENKAFFFTRFSMGEDPLATYRRIIQDAMDPYLEDGETLEIESARDAIDRFSKAAHDPHAEAELRIFYVECGTNFMLSYGYTDEGLCEDLLEMYEYATKTVLELPPKEQAVLKARLQKIMESANGIGWGYYDGLCDSYHEAFGDE